MGNRDQSLLSSPSAAPGASLSVRTITVIGAALPMFDGQPALRCARLHGDDAMGELFDYTLTLRTPEHRRCPPQLAADLDMQKLQGQPLRVSIELEDGAVREINGIVACIRGPLPDGERYAYHLTLRPWLWLATLASDYRIYQHKTAVDVLDALLKNYPFPVRKHLSPSAYPPLDYQVQYGETDFAFFQRIAQTWGIHWYFEHADGEHRLVLIDATRSPPPSPYDAYRTLVWHNADAQRKIDVPHLRHFEIVDQLVSGHWQGNDYDFMMPNNNLTVARPMPRDTRHGEQGIVEWPVGHGEGTGGEAWWTEGRRIATMRMEEIHQHGRRARGRGPLRGIVPGYTFTLERHPSQAANDTYVVLATRIALRDVAENSGDAPNWRVDTRFDMQSSTIPLRPTRTRGKPRVHGAQTAIVTGPPDQTIWTDAHGRVKVRFHWDRHGSGDEHSSCWLRVASPWQGNQFGATHIPRIGHEVLVEFLDGDPDRPIIAGQIVNAMHRPAWPLPAHAALSGFRSRELDGHRHNHLSMDDTHGQMQVQLASDHLRSQLVLGHNTRISDLSGRQDKRGEGFELRTDGCGAVRAARGLALVTDARPDARGHQMDIGESIERLALANQLHSTQGDLALHHGSDGEHAALAQSLARQHDALRGDSQPLGEFSQPHLLLASPSGIVATTTATTHWHSGEDVAVTAGRHVSMAAGKSLMATIAHGLRIFVHRLGMRLVAASGPIDIEAQDGNINVTAAGDIHLKATKGGRIILEADTEIVQKVGTAYVRITPEGIVEGMRGARTIRTGGLSIEKPDTTNVPPLDTPASHFDQEVFVVRRDGTPVEDCAFELAHDDEAATRSRTNVDGSTRRQRTLSLTHIKARLFGRKS